MSTISTEQQAFRDKLMSFGLSTNNINRIINQSITDTMELLMMDSDTLFTDGVMGTGATGVTAGQKMKIKALWSWCRHEYELGKRSIDVVAFDDDVRANWCYKVSHKTSNKEGQARADSGKQSPNINHLTANIKTGQSQGDSWRHTYTRKRMPMESHDHT